MKDEIPDGYEYLKEDLSVPGGRLMTPILGKKMKSACCDELLFVFVRATSEVELRCSNCNQYIGHMAPRAYAMLYQCLPASIRETVAELGFQGELTKEAMMEVEKNYVKLLVESSLKCLKQALVEHIGGGETVGETAGQDDESLRSSGLPENIS